MATTTDPTANGTPSVTISEADYRQLLAERRELHQLRSDYEDLRTRFDVLRSVSQDLHRTYRESLGIGLEDDGSDVPPHDPHTAIPFERFLEELNREMERK